MSRLGVCLALAASLASLLAHADPAHVRVLNLAIKANVAPASAPVAREAALRCATGTSWIERSDGNWVSEVSPSGWYAVCGDAQGKPLVVVDPRMARCDAKAELDATLAEFVGVDPDSAFEDSFAACIDPLAE